MTVSLPQSSNYSYIFHSQTLWNFFLSRAFFYSFKVNYVLQAPGKIVVITCWQFIRITCLNEHWLHITKNYYLQYDIWILLCMPIDLNYSTPPNRKCLISNIYLGWIKKWLCRFNRRVGYGWFRHVCSVTKRDVRNS